jgi:hypothetical protein
MAGGVVSAAIGAQAAPVTERALLVNCDEWMCGTNHNQVLL